MKIFKPKFWNKKYSFFSYALLPFSFFFQFLTYCKKKIIKKKKLSVPIICVGNIYIGGTGKTPLSIEVAKMFENFNKKTAIIKKNYKSHDDEFKLIEAKKITLFKNTSRILAIEEAIKNKIEFIILDDGLQDPTLHKDLNIVCFNERQLIGNGMILPSGPLRESLSSLKNYQITVINGDRNILFEKKIKDINKEMDIYYSNYLPSNLDKFLGKDLLAFAGIGSPDNFFNLLEKNNLKITKKVSYPDHYSYSLTELRKLIKFSLINNLKIITTEKDYFRIKKFKLPEIEFLNLKLEITNRESLEKKIIKYL